MKKRVTIKTIAAKVGVHYSTVSLALNNHPSIPEATRARIRQAATELGYRRDPVLSALVAYRNYKLPHSEYGVIAWIDAWPSVEAVHERYQSLWQGARRRAQSLGWKLEPFRPLRDSMSFEKLNKVLHSRGIEGIIMPPVLDTQSPLQMEWSRFTSVTVGHSLINPGLPRIVPHQFANMRAIYTKLRELGYQRIGLHLTPDDNNRSQRQWLAAFLEGEFASGQKRRTIPWIQNLPIGKGLLAWIKRHRFDAIISTHPDKVIPLLAEQGISVPDDIGVASPRCEPEPSPQNITSIHECFETIGECTVDVLVSMMHRNEKGLQKNPLQIMVEGEFRPGDTTKIQT